MERRTLTIESNYCENWTIQDAIREIIQNGLDTGTQVDIKPCVLDADMKQKWSVSDTGIGVKLSDFIIGRSSKRDNQNVIGQFGEGLKIGCLVLARNNRQISILSLGRRYDFSIQWDDTWQDKLLTIDISDTSPQLGTVVIMECSAEEIEKAKNLFMQINPQRVIDKLPSVNTEIIEPNPGIIWVNGLAVTKIDGIYGYNFSRKELVNRDRTAISIGAIKSCIAEALSTTTNESIIQNLIFLAKEAGTEGKIPTEFNVSFNPRKNTWLRVLRRMYGRKVCLSSHNPQTDLQALDKNWMVLTLPWEFRYSLERILPTADKVVEDKTRIVPFSKLTASQQKFLLEGKGIADEIAEAAGLKSYPVKVFVDPEKKESSRLFNWSQKGYFLDGNAGVCLQTIREQDMGEYVGTLLHEYTHGTCGHTDRTREFENDLTDIIASLGLALVAEKAKVKKVGLNYGLKRDLTS